MEAARPAPSLQKVGSNRTPCPKMSWREPAGDDSMRYPRFWWCGVRLYSKVDSQAIRSGDVNVVGDSDLLTMHQV